MSPSDPRSYNFPFQEKQNEVSKKEGRSVPVLWQSLVGRRALTFPKGMWPIGYLKGHLAPASVGRYARKNIAKRSASAVLQAVDR